VDIQNIVAKVKKKLEARDYPTTGTFYVIDDKILYSVEDVTGMPHKKMWSEIVKILFKDAGFLDKRKLNSHPWGAERGQVIWTGEMRKNVPVGNGEFIIKGTPGLNKYLDKIKKIFQLEDAKTDLGGAFKIVKEDEEIFGQMREKYPHKKLQTNLIII